MLYVIFPNTEVEWNEIRIFTNYSGAEQAVLQQSKKRQHLGLSIDWCIVIGYDGMDELFPTFYFSIKNGPSLFRQLIQ